MTGGGCSLIHRRAKLGVQPAFRSEMKNKDVCKEVIHQKKKNPRQMIGEMVGFSECAARLKDRAVHDVAPANFCRVQSRSVTEGPWVGSKLVSRQDFTGERASQPASQRNIRNGWIIVWMHLNKFASFPPLESFSRARVEPDQIEVESLVDFDAKRNTAAMSSNRAKAELRHLWRCSLYWIDVEKKKMIWSHKAFLGPRFPLAHPLALKKKTGDGDGKILHV